MGTARNGGGSRAARPLPRRRTRVQLVEFVAESMVLAVEHHGVTLNPTLPGVKDL
jgi:hypothetical protein